MADQTMKFGFTLSNRGVLYGVNTAQEMLELAEIADQSGLFQSVWVGDSLFGKPRMDSIALLCGVAARTKRVRLGPACMASFPLREPIQLAYQWASLDLLAEGRSILVACNGLVEQTGADVEARTYKVTPAERVGRVTEGMQILQKLWTEDNVTWQGKHYQFEGITIEPKPAAKPRPPVLLAVHARRSQELITRTHERIVKYTDGWQTASPRVEDAADRWRDILRIADEHGRDRSTLQNSVYHNFNINEDLEAAIDESRRFLEVYYEPMKFPREYLTGDDSWVATGPPSKVIAQIQRWKATGAIHELALRATSWDQRGQLKRLMEEVLPYV